MNIFVQTFDSAAETRYPGQKSLGNAAREARANEPSLREILLMAFVAGLLFVGVIGSFKNYPEAIDNFADSSGYIAVASAIRHWNFRGLIIKQFWGVSYLMAAISIISGLSDRASLIFVSVASYFASIAFVYRLWGGWVAGFFAVLNFDWFQRSFLGGSEPLFVALLFGSFLLARTNKWRSSSLLASLSTVVRPLGFFALIGIAVTLLHKRAYRKLAEVTLFGLGIGTLYMVPLWQQFGDPLATVHSYQQFHQPGPPLFGVPFYAIIKGTMIYPGPWTNLLLTFGWIGFVLVGTLGMFATSRSRNLAKQHLVETIFAACYILAIYSYNLPYWARGTFPRFAIPIVPFVIVATLPWLPKSRYVLWSLSIISPILAACSAIGIRTVAHVIYP
jgi:hypothetical protein